MPPDSSLSTPHSALILSLPHLNAALNTLGTLLLLTGWLLIRRGHYRAHAAAMIAALLVSAAFLAGYLVYHHHVGEQSTRHMTFLPRWLRLVYLSILFPHLILAMGMVPLILAAVIQAARRRWPQHRRLARPTLAVWLYVAITGVAIYAFLYHLFPALAPANG